MKYDFITVGGAVEDITFKTAEGVVIDNKKDILRQKLFAFEYGAKIKASAMFRFPGGGASNAAVCLSRLGFAAGAVAAVGDDEAGRRLMKNFDEDGVDTRLIKVSRGQETGFSFIVIGPGNEHVAFLYRGANDDLRLSRIDAQMLNYSKWVYVSSLSGDWEDALDKIFSAKNARTAWNPGSTQLKSGALRLRKFLKKTEILFLNKDEAVELAISENEYRKRGGELLKNGRLLAEILKKFGPKAVVITDGENGADYFSGDKFYHGDSFRVPPEKIADTTGVGDAFCSTFTAGLELYGGNIEKAMKLAMKNSASVLKESGAQNGLMAIN